MNDTQFTTINACVLIGLIIILQTIDNGRELEQDQKIEELEIQSMRMHWLESRSSCNQEREYNLLALQQGYKFVYGGSALSISKIDESEYLLTLDDINDHYSLCEDIANAWAMLAYRQYGEIWDQSVIDNWSDEN